MSEQLRTMLGRAAAAKKGTGSKRPAAARPGASVFTRLADLYARMEAAYNDTARRAGLFCAGCARNCCTSFFQHHTHVEWAYLWRGLNELPAARRDSIVERAREYAREANAALAAGVMPTAMCPLNDDGLCALYPHRLMICRMHGTRNIFTMPGGSVQTFAGCHRFVDLQKDAQDSDFPSLDRTPFYRELAALEMEFRSRASGPLPKVDMTLAEMIVSGPPRFR